MINEPKKGVPSAKQKHTEDYEKINQTLCTKETECKVHFPVNTKENKM